MANKKYNNKARGKASKGNKYGKGYTGNPSGREEYAKRNDCNDPSWYVPTDQNIKDVASFSFNNILGNNNHLNGTYGVVGDPQVNAITGTPGIATYFVTTIPGVGSTPNSPLNLAAIDIYNEIRRANSGTKVYDATDCMQLIVGLASIYSMVSWAQRLYGIANLYSSKNNYVPRDLVEANGVDFEDLRNNMNSFRTFLNQIILQVNTFNVPAGMPIFQRWFFLFEKIYADSNTSRAQLYQMVPEGYYLYDDADTTLHYHRLPYRVTGNLMKVSDIMELFNGMVNSLTYSEDARTISADIEKAFGSKLLNLSAIAENYTVVPDYSDEVRGQIMNAIIYDTEPTEGVSASISQDMERNCLVSTLKLHITPLSAGNMGDVWLNSHSDSVSPEEVMTSTRLIARPTTEESVVTGGKLQKWVLTFDDYVGSEVITGSKYTFGAFDYNTEKFMHKSTGFGTSRVVTGEYAFASMTNVILLSAFDWSPRLNCFGFINKSEPLESGVSSEDALTYVGIVMDIDNGTMLSKENLRLLHLTALLGEFGIPKLRG